MIKAIRILEVPILCLIMALACIQQGAVTISIFLGAVSVTRLVVNVYTDEAIYKKRYHNKNNR